MLFSKERKGQFSIEYLVAFVLFSSVLLYLSFQVSGVLPQLRTQSRRDVILSKAFRVTGNLVKNPGYPQDWNESAIDVQRYGLATKSHELSLDKIRKFNASCNENYSSVKSRLGLDRSDFRVTIYNSSENPETEIFTCGQRVPKGISLESVERYVVLENGNFVRMVFELW